MTDIRCGSREWSLVTVTYNSADHLRKCWTRASLGDAEWVVVDNASQDDSAVVARDLGARVIQLNRNVGFSAANNRGLASVRRPWLAFVNPDVTILASDLARLASVSQATGALVAPQLLNPDGSAQPNGRGLPVLVNKLAHRNLRLPGARLSEYVRTDFTRPTYVAWVIGAVVAGPTATFVRLSGWDERYFLYYEDHDLGLRAWDAGGAVVVDPEVRWTHMWQRATTRWDRNAWMHEVKSARVFYKTYPSLLSRRLARGAQQFRELDSKLWHEVGSDAS